MRAAIGVVTAEARPATLGIENRLQLIFFEVAVELMDISSRGSATSSRRRRSPIRRLKVGPGETYCIFISGCQFMKLKCQGAWSLPRTKTSPLRFDQITACEFPERSLPNSVMRASEIRFPGASDGLASGAFPLKRKRRFFFR
jgi:hypothetical protein